MSRCPLFIVLAALVAIILSGDSLGFSKPQEPPFYGKASCGAYILSVKETETSGSIAVAEIDSVDGRPVRVFKARIHILSEYPELIPGQRLSFTAGLQPLAPPPAIPDAIDLQAGLRRKGVTASVAVPRDSIHYIVPTASLRYVCAKANDAALCRLKRIPMDARTIDILAAMLLGRGDMVDDETRMTYSAAGLSHLLALSGMHVSFIAMIIAFALWPLYLGRHIRSRLALTIIALWAYAAFTGFIPSVTRAVTMASVYMFGRIIERRSAALNSLCLAAIMILMFSPEDIYSIGFQLSFAAVLGIIVFFPLINRVNRRNHPRLYFLASLPALSLSAMVLAGPVAAFHFHTYPVYFLPANILVIPVMPVLIFSGVICLLTGKPFICDALVGMLDGIASHTAMLPGAVLTDLYPPAWLIPTLIILLVVYGIAAGSGNRFMSILSAMVIVGAVICCVLEPKPLYPQSEVYTVSEHRSTVQITAVADSCFISADVKTQAERDEILGRYEIILRDFVARRSLVGPIMK